MERELRKHFINLLIYSSLDSRQLNYLGESRDSTFNLYTESGFGDRIPIPRQSAAETVVNYFNTEEDVVELFTILLRSEGKRFYNSTLELYNPDILMKYLEKRKWIYDPEMKFFFRDPFFEREINFLKAIRIIDLRQSAGLDTLITNISTVSKTLGDKDLEWSVNLRLYDLTRESSKLIQEILNMLLVRQDLQSISFDMFTCLKELAINASKANYKLLYEKHVTAPEGITSGNNYPVFLEMFKNEIAENGNTNLYKLAQMKDKFINITFQSTNTHVGIWVTNSQNITLQEKQAILKKLGYKKGSDLFAFADENKFNEGAGMGIPLVLSVLHLYSDDPIPLKVVFYPSFIKIGFLLERSAIRRGIENKNNTATE
ncbi:MAG: hypothetical protein ACOCWH_00415 [Spirochaetota bacterium]